MLLLSCILCGHETCCQTTCLSYNFHLPAIESNPIRSYAMSWRRWWLQLSLWAKRTPVECFYKYRLPLVFFDFLLFHLLQPQIDGSIHTLSLSLPALWLVSGVRLYADDISCDVAWKRHILWQLIRILPCPGMSFHVGSSSAALLRLKRYSNNLFPVAKQQIEGRQQMRQQFINKDSLRPIHRGYSHST